jgi:hypothetical protein
MARRAILYLAAFGEQKIEPCAISLLKVMAYEIIAPFHTGTYFWDTLGYPTLPRNFMIKIRTMNSIEIRNGTPLTMPCMKHFGTWCSRNSARIKAVLRTSSKS